MKSLNRFFLTPSIRRRISSAFLIVTLLVVATAVASYLQLRQVKPTTELIIRESSDMALLQKLSIATIALDADLEQYLVIGGLENRETVQKDLQDLADALRLYQSTTVDEAASGADLAKLEEIVNRLQAGVQQILDAQAGASAAETNRKIVLVYQDIEALKQLQGTLSAKVVESIQTTSESQSRIADTVLNQSIILGIIVLVVAAFTALLTDRRLRAISSLTNTAVAISGGDLSRVAPVESKDEIGTLAAAFNTMTSQLRDLIGSLEQRVSERTKALSSVAEVSTAASRVLDVQKMLEQVVYLTQRKFDLYHAHVFLYNENTDLLKIAACGWKEGDEHEGTHGTAAIPLAQEQSLVARAARTRQAVIVNDVRSDPGWLPNPLLPDTRAEMAVPLVVGDQMLGVLDVQSDRLNAFSEGDANIQTTLAAQVAVSLQNARSFAQTEQQRSQNEMILSSAGEGIFGLDEHGNHTFINPAAAAMLGYTPEELIGMHSHSTWHHTHADGTPFPAEECPIYFTVNMGIRNQGEEYFIRKDGSGFYVRFSSVPIQEQGRTIGAVVSFDDISQQKRDQEFVTQRARQQEAINLITQRIQATATIEDAMQVAARELGHALGMKPTLVTLDPAARDKDQNLSKRR